MKTRGYDKDQRQKLNYMVLVQNNPCLLWKRIIQQQIIQTWQQNNKPLNNVIFAHNLSDSFSDFVWSIPLKYLYLAKTVSLLHISFFLVFLGSKNLPCHVQPLASGKLHHPTPCGVLVAFADGVVLATGAIGASGYAAVGFTLGRGAL